MKKLYIIDDDNINNFLSENSIKKANFDLFVRTFTNPIEAISVLNELPFNPETIILLDLNMPEMSGWDVIAMLKHQYDIYILTSSVSPADRDKCRNYINVKGFISKPLTSETGQMVIQKADLFAA
jgi:response regulator RpfG family c-di-GMP phosphodiesterase